MRTLLQTDGLEAHLLALYVPSSPPSSQPKQRQAMMAWTSTPEYFVCRLLSLREFAQAGRVVCALWQVHPLLWDVENARLMLGSFVRSLRRPRPALKRSSDVVALAIEDARRHVADLFQHQFF
ncbi:hypothetical protein PINS_up004183 [Pythium insidiosum]|nr:hypothetical protein PINS_up004183 [Pythium insidiosum]